MLGGGKGATLESANDDNGTIYSTGTMVARLLLSLVALGLLVLSVAATSSDHTNNWAVLVCSSRFWFVPSLVLPPTGLTHLAMPSSGSTTEYVSLSYMTVLTWLTFLLSSLAAHGQHPRDVCFARAPISNRES